MRKWLIPLRVTPLDCSWCKRKKNIFMRSRSLRSLAKCFYLDFVLLQILYYNTLSLKKKSPPDTDFSFAIVTSNFLIVNVLREAFSTELYVYYKN